jgi:hypothetical protein
MFEKTVALNKDKHSDKGIILNVGYSFASRVTSAPLGLAEVSKAGREMPIVFTKEGPMVPVAQLGFQKHHNMFADDDGQWKGRYVPAHLRRFPFVLGEIGSETEFKIMIDEAAIVDRSVGAPLFEDDGVSEGTVVVNAKRFLLSLHREIQKASSLCARLRTFDVLVDGVLELKTGEKVTGRATGVQFVDWARVCRLDDVVLAQWVRLGLMDLISIHLNSVRDFGRFQGTATTTR